VYPSQVSLNIRLRPYTISLATIIITTLIFSVSFITPLTANPLPLTTNPTLPSTNDSSDDTNIPKPLWNYTTNNKVGTYSIFVGLGYTSPIIARGILYFDSEGYVYALNADNGKKIWATNNEHTKIENNPHKFPIVDNGKIFINGHRRMYALDANSGTIILEKQISSGTTDLVCAPPVVANGILYSGYETGVLRAIDATTGNIIWEFCGGITFPVFSSPLVVDNVVFGTALNAVFALDAQSGSETWNYSVRDIPSVSHYPLSYYPIVSSFMFDTGVLYFCASDGNVYALDADSGKELWNTPYTSDVSRIYIPSAPLLSEGLIYMGSDMGDVCVLNASDGTKLWNTTLGVGSLSAPALYDGVLYFGSSDGNLYAISATSGLELWCYPVSSPLSWDSGGVGSPVVCEGVLYVGGGDGVYALEVSSRSAPLPLRPISQNFSILIIIGSIAVVVACYTGIYLLKKTGVSPIRR
jgi:outer membrane protein assembly factor BamB